MLSALMLGGAALARGVFATFNGLLCFVPRITYVWASLFTRDWLRRMLKIPPPKI